MNAAGIWRRTSRVLQHPATVIGAIAAGLLCGSFAPEIAPHVRIIGVVYGDLLRMIVLPFVLSAIIFSLNNLLHDPNAARYIGRIGAVLLLVGIATAMLTAAVTTAMAPGQIEDPATLAAFGRIVAHDTVAHTDVETTLHAAPAAHVAQSQPNLLVEMLPTNVFDALAQGDVLKVLVFALMFGVAISMVPTTLSSPLTSGMETIYRSCQMLTRAFNNLLPFASFAMVADQAASIGLEPLQLMLKFLLVMLVITLIIATASIMVVATRVKRSPMAVLTASRAVIFAAIATRNSTACMTNMIDCMADQLHVRRTLVELLVPIYTALLRVGPTVMYVVVPIFVAQLYGKPLGLMDLGFVCTLGVLFGFASGGMSGLVVLAQAGLVCNRMGLPFDAALVLFVAVEPLSDTLRTLMVVLTIDAATAATAPGPGETEFRDSRVLADAMAGHAD